MADSEPRSFGLYDKERKALSGMEDACKKAGVKQLKWSELARVAINELNKSSKEEVVALVRKYRVDAING